MLTAAHMTTRSSARATRKWWNEGVFCAVETALAPRTRYFRNCPSCKISGSPNALCCALDPVRPGVDPTPLRSRSLPGTATWSHLGSPWRRSWRSRPTSATTTASTTRRASHRLSASHDEDCRETRPRACIQSWPARAKGGSRNFRFSTRSSESELHACIRLVRGVHRPWGSQNDVVFCLSEYDRRLRTPRPNMKGTV